LHLGVRERQRSRARRCQQEVLQAHGSLSHEPLGAATREISIARHRARPKFRERDPCDPWLPARSCVLRERDDAATGEQPHREISAR